MRSLGLCCLLALLVACAREEPADSAAAVDSTAMDAPAAPSLASYAGTWNMETMGMGSDSVLLRFTMTATADTTGWVYNFPKAAVPIRILSVESAGVITEAGPYESNLRPGSQVTTRATTRIVNDTLTGDVVATYHGTADSVVNLRTRGTRAQ